MRDDFSSKVKEILAKRVAYRCSSPVCQKPTSGPHDLNNGSINIGVAAHIEAASPGGKRYNPNQSRIQRVSIDNGIWLCQNCAKIIDSDELKYTVTVLRGWKSHTENSVSKEINNSGIELKIDDKLQLEQHQSEKKKFYKPYLVLHDKPLHSGDVVLTKFRNTGFIARNVFVAANLNPYRIENIFISKQEKIETDESITITLVGKFPIVELLDIIINFSYEDVEGRRYQQNYTNKSGHGIITPPEMLHNVP